MSGIVLSSSVRQNLLSLQSTADLLATTQNRLATGKKVNTALDNPTNFFTAQSLDLRAGDINNLLDGIGNGVQVLQAANTGITSLQKLVDTAKSIANQALQSAVGYSTKSNVSATITGATATDLRGTTTYTSATASSQRAVLRRGRRHERCGFAATTLGGTVGDFGRTPAARHRGDHDGHAAERAHGHIGRRRQRARPMRATSSPSTVKPSPSPRGDAPGVNGSPTPRQPDLAARHRCRRHHRRRRSGGRQFDRLSRRERRTPTTARSATPGRDRYRQRRARQQRQRRGTASTLNAGQTASTVAGTGVLAFKTSTGADSPSRGKADILECAEAYGRRSAPASPRSALTRTTAQVPLGNLIQDGSTLNVNGKTITFKNAPTPARLPRPAPASAARRRDRRQRQLDGLSCRPATIADVLKAIDLATGVQTATTQPVRATLATAYGQTNSSINSSGSLQISTGTNADLSIIGTGNALSALGLTGNTGTATAFTAGRTAAAGSLSGKTLTFTSFNGGAAVNVTFGDGSNGTVKTLDQLNAALLANNLNATLDSTGKLTISTTNDYASSTLGSAAAGGAIGGTLTTSITFTTASAPVVDASAQTVRSNLVNQFNGILSQITTTAQDASFNGVNLLGGDQLKLTFNETGKSTLEHHRRDVQRGGPRSGEPDERYRLHRQLRHQQGYCQPEQRLDLAAHAGFRLGFEPVDRADPSGLLEEPDQRAADRLVEPDAGRHQRGSGEQPGAVDPPVDRGVRAGAGQPEPAERAAAPALSGTATSTIKAAGKTPPPPSI